jgi:RNA polymerase sigma-70 factor (ECF subfamily)
MLDFRGTVQAAQAGDQEAFARLWREFQPGLLRYLKIKAAPVAEDLAADIWLRVLKSLPSFQGDEHGFRGWLYTTARNRLTDWYRSGERRPDLIEYSSLVVLPAVNNVEEEAAEHSATDQAIALIAELPPDQAEAVMLRIVVGMDVARVAELMDRSAGSVRVLCHRGLRRLELRLGELGQVMPQPSDVLAGVGTDGAIEEAQRLHA